MSKTLHDFPYDNDRYGQYIIPEFQGYDSLIAVDIGSHLGGFIKRNKDMFSLIHYYEANPVAYNIINSKHQGEEKIIGFNEAVSNYEGEAKILYHPNNDSGSLSIENPHQDRKQWGDVLGIVNTTTLEKVLERVGGEIHFLKMDCETSEFSILMNQDLSKIHYLAMEIHCQLGEENWNSLISHILKYFDIFRPNHRGRNPLLYDGLHNAELHFVNKKFKEQIR
jgi:FkbM family methyltransferase